MVQTPLALNWSPAPTSTAAATAHYDGTAHGTTVSATPVNGFGDVISAGKKVSNTS